MTDIKNIANLIAYLVILIILLNLGDDFAAALSIKTEAVLVILLALKELFFNTILNFFEKERVSKMIDNLIVEYKEGCETKSSQLIPYEYYFSIIKFARNILYRSNFSEEMIKKISKFESDLTYQKNNAVKTFDQHINI